MRSEEQFDAGAKYHIAANLDYVRYFTGHIYEFQFLKSLCIAASQYDPNAGKPLHQCNLYGNKQAGELLKSFLKYVSMSSLCFKVEIVLSRFKTEDL